MPRDLTAVTTYLIMSRGLYFFLSPSPTSSSSRACMPLLCKLPPRPCVIRMEVKKEEDENRSAVCQLGCNVLALNNAHTILSVLYGIRIYLHHVCIRIVYNYNTQQTHCLPDASVARVLRCSSSLIARPTDYNSII